MSQIEDFKKPKVIDSSQYIAMQRAAVVNGSSNSIDPTKLRAPLSYGGFYRPSYKINVRQPTLEINPIIVTLDFTTTLEGVEGSQYVIYNIPSPTNSITITYSNMFEDSYVEIDSDTFDFSADNSQLIIDGNSGLVENYGEPYFATYAMWITYTGGRISNNSTVKLKTNSLISGPLYVGYYY